MPETFSDLIALFQSHGGKRFFAKPLSPNDNSKNQVYLGGDFASLNLVPHGAINIDQSSMANSKRERAKADVSFFWVNDSGRFRAPIAQLVLYPKYPEVRFSGFLKGCKEAPRDLMSSRESGRVLFLSTTDNGNLLGMVSASDAPLAKEFEEKQSEFNPIGVFFEFFLKQIGDNRSGLLDALKRVSQKGWINSKKLSSSGVTQAYSASNGGGYTLEAELGIRPNSYAAPDYLGWEVKQYGVRDLLKCSPKSPVTLFTPEPNAGLYFESGAE